jgi:hypothetical protein
MWSLSFCRFMVLGFALAALAQQPPVVSPSAASSVDNDFIKKQFGSTCTLMPGPPQMKADMDGDGVEDLIVAARCAGGPDGEQFHGDRSV